MLQWINIEISFVFSTQYWRYGRTNNYNSNKNWFGSSQAHSHRLFHAGAEARASTREKEIERAEWKSESEWRIVANQFSRTWNSRNRKNYNQIKIKNGALRWHSYLFNCVNMMMMIYDGILEILLHSIHLIDFRAVCMHVCGFGECINLSNELRILPHNDTLSHSLTMSIRIFALCLFLFPRPISLTLTELFPLTQSSTFLVIISFYCVHIIKSF